jgi:hypothetical protein
LRKTAQQQTARQAPHGVTPDGRVKATVAFADGEQVTLDGYAEKPPRVEASEGSAGPLFYDSSSHRFKFTVSPSAGREASILLRSR